MNARKTVLISMILALLLAPWACASGEDPALPERIVSKRMRILAPERYEEIRAEWEAYTARRPGDAMGWTELAKASRYAGVPCEKYIEFAEKAIEADPDYADAYNALGSYRWCMYCGSQPENPAGAIALLHRALELDPSSGEPYYSLWPMELYRGNEEAAVEHLREMIRGGHMPEPLVDQAHNMLVGVEPNAIILTNGDNDTYPPLALQALRGFRTDVSIVNLSLLNTQWYRKEIRRGPNAVPVPILEEKPKGPPAGRALNALIDSLAEGGWKRPLYAAITLNFKYYAIANDLSLEGMVYRVLPSEGGEKNVDGERLAENLGEKYRVDSATSLGFDWERHSALRYLMSNYAAAYMQLGGFHAGEGRIDEARDAMRRALEICKFHDRRALGRGAATMWKEWDEESMEPDRWAEKFKE